MGYFYNTVLFPTVGIIADFGHCCIMSGQILLNSAGLHLPLVELASQPKAERQLQLRQLRGERPPRCRLAALDPDSSAARCWTAAVSAAVLYNLWLPLFRLTFAEVNARTAAIWLPLDYAADCLYLADIGVSLRTGYLQDGVLQLRPAKMRANYVSSGRFCADCLSLLPLDSLYVPFGFNSALRLLRLCKVYKVAQFLDSLERRASHPNAVRFGKLLHHLLLLIHCNACLLQLWGVDCLLENSRNNSRVVGAESSVAERYLSSLYWSSQAVSLMSDLPRRRAPAAPNGADCVFAAAQIVLGLLVFASVLGHVAAMVSDAGRASREFQSRLDSVKTYMSDHRVPRRLQRRVIRWFDYLWQHTGVHDCDEASALALLPDRLKAELAIQAHLDTLKRIEMFRNTEEGFLTDLVLRLRPVLFSPGDFVCRKGEVGKHMYIVSRGRLQVVESDPAEVGCSRTLATLQPGSYFGEISVLNMGRMGNRRTASVRSVGYSHLFCLARADLWEVLKDHPTARVKLEAIAVRRLKAFERRQFNDAVRSRSLSTPGLVQASALTPLLLSGSCRGRDVTKCQQNRSQRHREQQPRGI